MKALSVIIFLSFASLTKCSFANKTSLEIGMDMVTKAYDTVCRWEIQAQFNCHGQQSFQQEQILTDEYFKNHTDEMEPTFARWTKKYSLPDLPRIYQDRCSRYLDNARAYSPVNESDALGSQSYDFRAFAHCLMGTLRKVSKGKMKRDPLPIATGMKMVVKAYHSACRYAVEFQVNCTGKQQFQQKQIMTGDFFKTNPGLREAYFGEWSRLHTLPLLPKRYRDECEKYLRDSRAEPSVNESKFLNDTEQLYPYKALAHCLVHVLREVSNGTMKRDVESIKLGMEIVTRAFDEACRYAVDYQLNCSGQQAFQQKQILTGEFFKTYPEQREPYFKHWTKKYVLPLLPRIYKVKCGRYLDDPEAVFPVNESAVLNDSAQLFLPFRAYSHCIISTLRKVSNGTMKRDIETIKLGMEMVTRAYNAVCWYHGLKQYPFANISGYVRCYMQQSFQQNYVLTKKFFSTYPEQREPKFGEFTKNYALPKLPREYQENCEKFLDNSKAKPLVDESDALNDNKKAYPYRAFAYCLLNTLRKLQGDDAIEAVKNEKTYRRLKKPWRKIMLERENMFRARHGVDPLRIEKELNDAAQAYAELMPSTHNCTLKHTIYSQRYWRGQGTGENLHWGKLDLDEMAYFVPNDFYAEIEYYPYPVPSANYTEVESGKLGQIGHFTQMIWKNSKLVGFGYFWSPECKNGFTVARYYPAGNMQGLGENKYADFYPLNVLPPKDNITNDAPW